MARPPRKRGPRRRRRTEAPAGLAAAARSKARSLCAACGRLDRRGQVDHVVPLADGGANTQANLQFLCRACHARKTARENAARDRERLRASAAARERKRALEHARRMGEARRRSDELRAGRIA